MNFIVLDIGIAIHENLLPFQIETNGIGGTVFDLTGYGAFLLRAGLPRF